jgi:dihydropteroate synthase
VAEIDPRIRVIDCRGRALALDRPRIMGVINVTPDSFSDGGRFADPEAAIAHGLRLVEEGADLLDVGGESTRPGAEPVPLEEELRRVLPVIEGLAARVGVPIAVDTSKPEVMRRAVAAGAGMINDVFALCREGALEAAAELEVPVVLMHMQGEPATMQDDPRYLDVVGEVRRFLAERVFACEMAGIPRARLIVDPGFGFGKTLEHNLELLARLKELEELGLPLLVGLSRKSMIGRLTGRERPDERLAGSLAAALLAVEQGADIVRVHDVAATREALAVRDAVAARRRPARREARPQRTPWDED